MGPGPIICLGLVLLTSGAGHASGCFGGQPDMLPRPAATDLPANTQVRIAVRDVMSVAWFGPDGRAVRFGERKVGRGPSTARVLTPEAELARGAHTLRTTDPDMDFQFEVAGPLDRTPPTLHGSLALEGYFAPEADSSCPTNIWISMSVPVPQDDNTADGAFSYLVFLGRGRQGSWHDADLLVHAESVADGWARFRIGETGCGCIARAELRRCTRYRVTLVAVDAAGNLSPQSLSGEVTIPGCA
jgi:hypothetical protein